MKLELNIETFSWEELEALSQMVHEERKKRLAIRVKRLPAPKIDYTLNRIDNTKKYRTEHKCDLMEAHVMIGLHWKPDGI